MEAENDARKKIYNVACIYELSRIVETKETRAFAWGFYESWRDNSHLPVEKRERMAMDAAMLARNLVAETKMKP